jgi:hypothetical protein
MCIIPVRQLDVWGGVQFASYKELTNQPLEACLEASTHLTKPAVVNRIIRHNQLFRNSTRKILFKEESQQARSIRSFVLQDDLELA